MRVWCVAPNNPCVSAGRRHYCAVSRSCGYYRRARSSEGSYVSMRLKMIETWGWWERARVHVSRRVRSSMSKTFFQYYYCSATRTTTFYEYYNIMMPRGLALHMLAPFTHYIKVLTRNRICLWLPPRDYPCAAIKNQRTLLHPTILAIYLCPRILFYYMTAPARRLEAK